MKIFFARRKFLDEKLSKIEKKKTKKHGESSCTFIIGHHTRKIYQLAVRAPHA